ncbi:oxygen-independent coproporphyrinogen III oxidase [Moraxella atlantae]|uniref:Coproporphyrinogen-III oxidase n=1 Tax=Faucicola atlantae TaxID=34059 RepID=A0A378Q664_9GAMM|nr:oxygen-independent coproporphyrinogen III oxidase [Moraxella atlantae]OPH34855.1 oxygen-independent coproporphyrinogen III oxidase [Moraxella atlantae]STY96229.1 Oxygen-independent coproporphyrinogen-III oxidase [Moraxella atlantae]
MNQRPPAPDSAPLAADEQPFFSRPADIHINPYADERADAYTPVYDAAMIAKYDRTGPRYTSYPTALEFKPIAADTEARLLVQQDPNTPLSLYIHVPFCRHLCYYCACNKIITKKNSDAGDYMAYVEREVRHKRSLLQGEPIVEQVHFGGGTPTFLSDDELVDFWQFLQGQFRFSDKPTTDFSIEIDPRELRDTTLATLRALGFNRLSFGVQDLDLDVQLAVNRQQPLVMIEQVMQQARALGFVSINIDLMYGLPRQTVASLQNTIAQIIALSPDRLSVFNYAHLPERFASQRRINNDELPNAADKLTMFANTIEQLTAAGYQYIGIDHFAKPDDALAIAQRAGKLRRNFQGYTTHGDCDLLGFGVSAISQLGADYLQNASDLKAYEQTIAAHRLPAVKHIHVRLPDLLRRYVIMQLLCHHYVDFKDINVRFSVDAVTYFIDEIQQLAPMQADKLIDMDAKGIRILPKGRLLARNVAMVFDQYLNHANQQRFSRAI